MSDTSYILAAIFLMGFPVIVLLMQIKRIALAILDELRGRRS